MNVQMQLARSERDCAGSFRFALEPFPKVRKEWGELVKVCPAATMYQRESWLSALARAYGFEFKAATLRDDSGELAAAALFARGKNPLARKWSSLPCSDSAPPLARDERACAQLLTQIAASELPSTGLVEIRGWDAPEPWRAVDCFAQWQLELDRPMDVIHREMAGNFRRQLRRGCQESYQIESGSGLDSLKRFYRVMLETRRRLGVPAQPWRFFKAVFDAFSTSDGLEVWTCSRRNVPIAAMVMLGEGTRVHYKWSARLDPTPPGATHAMLGAVLEKYSQRYEYMDLGRTDVRNSGLSRFKRELGAKPCSLRYLYTPRVPAHVSPEIHGESQQLLSRVWRNLPLPVTRVLGSVLYGYLV